MTNDPFFFFDFFFFLLNIVDERFFIGSFERDCSSAFVRLKQTRYVV